MDTIHRMKSIQQCFLEIKKLDPESAVSEWLIRTLCKKQIVRYIPCGSKSLVDYDDLLAYINGTKVATNEK